MVTAEQHEPRLYHRIQLAAARVNSFATNVGRAYAFEIPSGPHQEPWGLECQQELIPVHLETVPSTYVAQVGRRFADCATSMRPVVSDLHDEAFRSSWTRLIMYLDSYSAAASAHVGLEPDADSEDLDPIAPSILRYDLIARLVDSSAINALADDAAAVEEHCRHRLGTVLTAEEQLMIRRLDAGLTTMDLAVELGFSERETYRRLRQVWTRLGASSRSQGLAAAARAGYI